MKKIYVIFLSVLALILMGQAAFAQSNLSTDYFRSNQSGPWESVATWEYSKNGTTWLPATRTPNYEADTVIIQSGHSVAIYDELFIDELVIEGTLTVQPGTFFNLLDNTDNDDPDMIVKVGGSFILKSDATNSAVFYRVDGDATVEQHNNVTVERYIPANRAHRLMTIPLRSGSGTNTSIYATLQNGGVYEVGKGTHVTANVTPTSSNGIDAKTTLPTIQTWAGSGYAPVDNTKSTPMFTTASSAANKAYFVFVRGDRNPNNLNATDSNATTLSGTGELQIGGQTFTDNGTQIGRLVMVPNPYASPVDFKDVARSNYYDRFYAWDSRRNDFGGFILVEGSGNGSYTVTPQSGIATTAQDQIIQSAQAVFMQASASGPVSVSFSEVSKSNLNKNGMFRPAEASKPTGADEKFSFRANLMTYDANKKALLADGVYVEFDNNYSNAFNFKEDAIKIPNTGENFGLIREGKELMLERRASIKNTDTLFFAMSNLKQGTYQLELTPVNMSAGLSAFLEDAYLKTSTPLQSDGRITKLDFKVGADAGSFASDRFMIIFRSNSVLPVSFLNVQATQKNNSIQVEWAMANETSIKSYEIEKSANGRVFSSARTLSANLNNGLEAHYNWLDDAPVVGDNYYRIKAIDFSGEVKYSQVVKIRSGKGASEILAYPNPVKNNIVSLQFTDQPAGKYSVQLINSQGQIVYSAQIAHPGGSSTQTVSFNKKIMAGVYQLQVKYGLNLSSQKLVFN